jgi:hypothetical protein
MQYLLNEEEYKQFMELKKKENLFKNNSFALRPATPEDVIVGNVFVGISSSGEDHPFIHRIDEVYKQDDPFKGYLASDGCRYGYDDMYLLIIKKGIYE